MAKTYIKPATPTVKVVEAPRSNSPMRARPREHLTSIPQSEFKIGPFVVRCSNKQHYRLYSIYTPSMILIGKQASYPSIYDCIDKLEAASSKGEVSYTTYSRLVQNREVAQLIEERMLYDPA